MSYHNMYRISTCIPTQMHINLEVYDAINHRCHFFGRYHYIPTIKNLIMEQKEKPGLLQNPRGTWVKPLDAFKEPYLCSPLQNLLLYIPGCIEVDEFNDHLFFSDTNHHRIIVFDGNGKILDSIGSSPGFEDEDFECSSCCFVLS